MCIFCQLLRFMNSRSGITSLSFINRLINSLSLVSVAARVEAVSASETPLTLGLPFPFPCFPGQFRYCLSKRGKPAIEVGAHRFCFNGRAASGKVWWRCSRNPRCRAAVHTFGLRVVQMNSAHTCGVRATPVRPMF